MTYHQTFPAVRRTRSARPSPDRTIWSIALGLGLGVALFAALAVTDMPEIMPAAGDDWHGNVAASGYRK